MQEKAEKLIDFFEVPLRRNGPIREAVTICTPATGSMVGPNFTAKGTLSPPDTKVVSCKVGTHNASSITNSPPLPPGNWSASFTATPVGGPVPLTATGNFGGADTEQITVVAGGGPVVSACVTVGGTAATYQKEGNVSLDALQVERGRPRDQQGPTFRVSLAGGALSEFTVGGEIRPPAKVVQATLGNTRADSITNEGGHWSATFSKVVQGMHTLKVVADDGSSDTIRVEVVGHAQTSGE